jgi:hypothetical protein
MRLVHAASRLSLLCTARPWPRHVPRKDIPCNASHGVLVCLCLHPSLPPQEQQTVTELRLQLEQHAAAAAALQDVQKQLQAKTEALSNTHKQLREEQRGRAAAEAAVKQAERALERAKTSLQDKLESERENLLVYGRSVHEVRVDAGSAWSAWAFNIRLAGASMLQAGMGVRHA